MALAPHSSHLTDTGTMLDVQLVHEHVEFPPAIGRSAICWLGGEFIRFGSITALGNGKFRLTKLQRGCFGTEAAILGHQNNERFVLLEPQTVRLVEDVALISGPALTVEAIGVGDETPVAESLLLTGRAITPLPPVHAAGREMADGSVNLTWVRRSRIDFGWNDGVEQPTPEDNEQYSVSVFAGGQVVNSWMTQESAFSLSSAAVADLVATTGPTLTFSIRQIGRYMQSALATIKVIVTS